MAAKKYKYLEITYDLFVNGKHMFTGLFSIPLNVTPEINKEQAIASVMKQHSCTNAGKRVTYRLSEKFVNSDYVTIKKFK